jgi:hypothetical protein
LFEGHVAAEILKSQINRGGRKEIYHFRDQQGLEVDFLFPSGKGSLWMVECKAAKTVMPAVAAPMKALQQSIRSGEAVRATVVYRRSESGPPMRALSPGVEALDIRDFANALSSKKVAQTRGGTFEKSKAAL